ncbi:MAG: nucleotidyltransferase family protein [Thermodesulfobacteriota bacterium]|nr:nucleotidyltransferase family protein [Thermodesulfobacteriota bacterium]
MKLNRQSSIINPIALSPEESLLVLAARVEMDSDDETKMEDILRDGVEWSEIEASAGRLGVEPLLHKHLSQERYAGYVPDEALHLLKESYHRQSIRSLRIYGQLGRILESMNQADVPTILLKGTCLAKWIYGDISLRPMNDIDILCRDEDAGAAQDVFRGLGYEQVRTVAQSKFHEQVSLSKKHLPPFSKPNAVRIEVHTDIFAGVPCRTREMDRVWEKAIPLDSDGLEVNALSLEHQLLHLFFHLHHHFMSRNVTLYWFCDIHEFVERYGEEIDWKKLQAIAESLGIASRIATFFDLLIRHWKTRIPEYIVHSPDAGFNRLSLKWAIFGKKIDSREFLPSRIRRLKDIKKEYGWGNSFYYVLRHFFPARSHIIHRYKPRNQREICRCYISHIYQIFRHALLSLLLIISTAFQNSRSGHEKERAGYRR